MTDFSKDWAFLPQAWKLALVVTGREAAATELVSATLDAVVRRADLHERERTKRVFFSMLLRAPGGGVVAPETAAEHAVSAMHRLPDPGRRVLALLYLGLFGGDELAEIAGESAAGLARTLNGARGLLSGEASS